MGKGIHLPQPKFNPQIPLGGRRELIPANCPQTSTPWHAQPSPLNKYNEKEKGNSVVVFTFLADAKLWV